MATVVGTGPGAVLVDDFGIPIGPAGPQVPQDQDPQRDVANMGDLYTQAVNSNYGAPAGYVPEPPPEPAAPAAAPAVPAGVPPGAVPAGALPTGTTQQTGTTTRQATSTTAVNQPKADKYTRETNAILGSEDAKLAEEVAKSAPTTEAFTTANEQAVEGTSNEAAARAAQAKAMSFMQTAQADLEGQTALDYQNASDAIAHETEVAKQNYQQKLLEFQNSDVNPAALWGSMSGGAKLGTLMSAFITDFLGTKGIKTSAMDIFNRAVDQSINSQVENIRKKGQVAEGFKGLWDMAMSEGKSELEAKRELRGFYLAQAKTKMEAELSKYDSAIYQAQGQKAIAELDKALAQNLYAIQTDARNRASDRVKTELDTVHANRREAIERQSNAIAQGQLNLAKDQFSYAKLKDAQAANAAAQAQLVTPEGIIRNPLTGEAEKMQLSEKDGQELKEKAGFSGEFKYKMDKFIEKAEKVGAVYNGPGSWLIDGKESTELKAMWEDVAWSYAQALSGKAMTNAETERAKYLTQIGQVLKPGSKAALVKENTAANVMQSWEGATRLRTRNFTPTEAQVAATGAWNMADAGGPTSYKKEYESMLNGPVEETEVDTAMKDIYAPNASTEKVSSKLTAADMADAGIDLTVGGTLKNNTMVPRDIEGLSKLHDTVMSPKSDPHERDVALSALVRAAEQGDSDLARMGLYYLQDYTSNLPEGEAGPEVNRYGDRTKEQVQPRGTGSAQSQMTPGVEAGGENAVVDEAAVELAKRKNKKPATKTY